jgi:hypothetical protein
MDIEIEKVKDLMQKLVDAGESGIEDADAEKLNAHSGEINNIIDKVLDVFGDGLQLNDVTRIGEIVEPVMELASTFEDYAGEDKKRFVIQVVNLVYKVIDTYPTGKENNINIPFVMGALERKIEHGILTFATGMAIDAVYKGWKNKD